MDRSRTLKVDISKACCGGAGEDAERIVLWKQQRGRLSSTQEGRSVYGKVQQSTDPSQRRKTEYNKTRGGVWDGKVRILVRARRRTVIEGCACLCFCRKGVRIVVVIMACRERIKHNWRMVPWVSIIPRHVAAAAAGSERARQQTWSAPACEMRCSGRGPPAPPASRCPSRRPDPSSLPTCDSGSCQRSPSGRSRA